MGLPWDRTGRGGLLSPLQLGNLSAWYDASQLSSMIVDGSNRVSLWGDVSGNSSVNVLALNGVIGNYARTPNAVPLQITGDLGLRVRAQFANWQTIAIDQYLIGKSAAANGCYQLYLRTDGKLGFQWSPDGTTTTTLASTAAVSFSAFQVGWVRLDFDVDNGSAGNTATFYTSPDGTNWTVLGAPVITAGVASMFASSVALNVGFSGGGGYATGNYYQAQVLNGISPGTLVFDANFALPAKLATSFIESSSNAATVTINTSGDTGARISGPRDLVQLTVSKQPIYSVVSGYARITADGVDDYMKSAPFAFAQPETVYLTGQQVSWTISESFLDGGSNSSLGILQRGTTPNVGISAGIGLGTVPLALQANGVISTVYNGVSSSVRVNRGIATTGDAGTNPANGVTFAALASGAAQIGNVAASEIALCAAAHDAPTQDRYIQYSGRKWGIGV